MFLSRRNINWHFSYLLGLLTVKCGITLASPAADLDGCEKNIEAAKWTEGRENVGINSNNWTDNDDITVTKSLCWTAITKSRAHNEIRLRLFYLMPNTHRRRRRDATVELSRVGGVYWALVLSQLYGRLKSHVTEPLVQCYSCLMLYEIHAVPKLIADIQTRRTGSRQMWRHVAAVRAPAWHDVRASDVSVTRWRHRRVGDVSELARRQGCTSGMAILAGGRWRERADGCARWKVVRRWRCNAETISGRTRLFISSLTVHWRAYDTLYTVKKVKRLKERIAVSETSPITELRASRQAATVLPATRHKWTCPTLTPTSKLVPVRDLPTPEGWKVLT